MFQGKRALVLGVANKRSIAWAIAKRLADGGAQLAFTYQGERIEKNVRELAESVSSPLVTELDVRSDEQTARVFAEVGEAFGGQLDVLVHSVAFAAAEDLEGRFVDTPRERFWMAIDVSAYSLVSTARAAEPLMEAAGGGSIVTMTYLGGERAVPHYNVMGVAKATLDSSVKYLAWDLGRKNIRVNAISAGPVRTLAARSIAGFPTMESIVEERSPLHRHIDSDDVGAAAAYLLGDDASNVSGTTLYVDGGYHAMGMYRAAAPPNRLARGGMCRRAGARDGRGRFTGRDRTSPCRVARDRRWGARVVQRELPPRRGAAAVPLDDPLLRPDRPGRRGRPARRRRRDPVPALPPVPVRSEREHEADRARRAADRVRPHVCRGAHGEEPGRRDPRPAARPAVVSCGVANGLGVATLQR
jgi:enoyl-[acyl-carrier protein] reductase I